jgi:16S rRNA (adenine1518-N6/adenine1519-N6)-dimethyltransferase
VRARKRFGQHFLEPAWVDKVVRAIDPKPDQTFIEIGPGRGALTRPLAARAKAVIAYEIDRDLAADLRAVSPSNVTVVEGDVLDSLTDQSLIPNPQSLRVAGNLPYNVASPIMFKLAELVAAGLPVLDSTLMLQREVADRLISKPGTREYGVLSVLLQHVADIEMILKLPAGAFRPPPRVLSALVRLRFHPPAPSVANLEVFAGLVRSVFTRRRKTLANALLAVDNRGRESFLEPKAFLELAGIDGQRRPETMTVAEFARIADVYAAKR